MNDAQPPPNPSPRRWLTTAEAARYLCCSKNFLDKDRLNRLHGIPFARLGRHIRYDIGDLDEILTASKQAGNNSPLK